MKTPDIPTNRTAEGVPAASREAQRDSGDARSPALPLAADAWVDTLTHLAAVAGVPCSSDRAREAAALALRETDEPMAQLMAAAHGVGLRVTPIRTNVADAVWTADAAMPLVCWSPVERRWIVIRRHGALRALVSSAENPVEKEPITRFALARLLGLDDVLSVAEFGLVEAERLTDGMSAQGDPHGDIHGQRAHHGHGVSPLRRYLGLMRPEGPDVRAMVIFGLAVALLNLALPLAVNSFVSNLSFGNQATPLVQALLFLGLALFLALALSAVIRGLQIYTAEVIQRRLFVRLVADLTYRLPRVKTEAFHGLHAPELVNRFLDIVTVQKVTARLLLDGIEIVLGAGVGTIVLGFYHPTLLGFSILVCVVVSLAVLLGRGALRANIQESQIKYEIVGWLEELARHQGVFKSAGGHALAHERSDLLSRRFLQARKAFFRILMRQIVAVLVLEVIAISGLLIIGGWLVLNQQLTLGQLVASELIVSMIVYSVAKLGRMFESWYDGMTATDKIGHLVDLEMEPEGGDAVAPQPHGMKVEVRDLGFGYVPGQSVFSQFGMEMEPGECVALRGTQGSGASTLLKLLNGMGLPQDGYIRLDGMDIRSWSLERLREQVLLLRDLEIVNGTVIENVRLGRVDIGLDVVTTALDRVRLLDDVLALPFGLNTTLVSGGLPLSGRQRIRLLLARALVLKPRLLLLDEMLDGTGVETVKDLFATARAAAPGWTVLVATRDPVVAEQCDRVIRLDRSLPAAAGSGSSRQSH